MAPQAVFGISVLLGLVVWGIIGARDIWPALRTRPRAEALRPLLLLHAFRFVRLAFLVPGVVAPDLPTGFARPRPMGTWRRSFWRSSRSPRWAVAGHHAGKGVQCGRHRRSALRVLSGQSPGGPAHARAAGGRVLHSDRAGPVAPRDARPGLRYPAQTRCNGRCAKAATARADRRRSPMEASKVGDPTTSCAVPVGPVGRAHGEGDRGCRAFPLARPYLGVRTLWAAADRPADAVR